jgi:hypothetical protein
MSCWNFALYNEAYGFRWTTVLLISRQISKTRTIKRQQNQQSQQSKEEKTFITETTTHKKQQQLLSDPQDSQVISL